MKIKFLFGLVFVLSAFVMQAQYVGPSQATQILESQATALANGTLNIKDLAGTTNVATTGSTLTGLSNSQPGDIPVAHTLENVFPPIMHRTAKEIEKAGNTALGVQIAETFFRDMDPNDSNTKVFDSAFAYIKDLISI